MSEQKCCYRNGKDNSPCVCTVNGLRHSLFFKFLKAMREHATATADSLEAAGERGKIISWLQYACEDGTLLPKFLTFLQDNRADILALFTALTDKPLLTYVKSAINGQFADTIIIFLHGAEPENCQLDQYIIQAILEAILDF